jgi:hypothetical protein
VGNSRQFIIGFLLVFTFLAILTNPSKQDYLSYTEEQSGIATPESIEIERINFYLFSTYAPMMPMDHYGIVHLGFIGIFFKISEGQYDYPKWLEFFH